MGGYSQKALIILVGAFICLAIGSYGVFKIKNFFRYIIIIYLIGIVFCLKIFFPNSFYNNLLLFLIVPSVIIGFLTAILLTEKPIDPIKDVDFETNKGKYIIRNIFRGVVIFGATRSGKTASVIYKIMKHFAHNKFAGVMFDYKNGELTELMYPLMDKKKLKIISINNPNISQRINVIDPKYIKDEKDVETVVKVIMSNLKKKKSDGDNFFDETAQSLMSAIILRFMFDYKEYCTIPHIIAFILAVDFSLKKEDAEHKSKGLSEDSFDTFLGLKKFLIKNKRVKIQASAFILGLASEKQTAGVISTLANALRKLAFPNSFWVLSKNDMDLDISHDKNRFVVSVYNDPKDDETYEPFIAMIIQMMTRNMMIRDRKPSFILLDEAPTIKLNKMARIPATMASFNVCTVYASQDLTQGSVQYGKEEFKEIISNFTTQIYGKANNIESAKYYESFSGLTKEKNIVTSTGGKGAGGKSTSYREVPKVKYGEFLKFKQGEFLALSDGVSKRFIFKKPNEIREEIKPINKVTNEDLVNNYNRIIDEIEEFAKSQGLSI